MDGLCVAALIVGGAGLVGGIVWGWSATRTAVRVAFKIVAATKGEREDQDG